MIVSGIDLAELDHAVQYASSKFSNNLTYLSGTPDRKGIDKYRVRLRVKDYNGPGWRLSMCQYGIRNIPNACWHVIGEFLNALPPSAKVHFDARSSGGPSKTWRPGDPWDDWMYGLSTKMSEMCNCGQDTRDNNPYHFNPPKRAAR